MSIRTSVDTYVCIKLRQLRQSSASHGEQKLNQRNTKTDVNGRSTHEEENEPVAARSDFAASSERISVEFKQPSASDDKRRNGNGKKHANNWIQLC